MGKTVVTLAWRAAIVAVLFFNLFATLGTITKLNDHDRAAADMLMQLHNRQNFLIKMEERQEKSIGDLWENVMLAQDKASYASNTASDAFHHMIHFKNSMHTHTRQKTQEPPK